MKGPYLVFDPVETRYYRAAEPHECHGGWVHGVERATAYPTRAAAEAAARHVHGWRWRTRLTIHRRDELPTPRRQLTIPAFARRFL